MKIGDIFGLFSDLLSLTKPRLSFMVILTALCGMGLASSSAPEAVNLTHAFWALLGTSFIVGAANAFNCYFERKSDALMTRTQNRPLAAGRLNPALALSFSSLLFLSSIYLLWKGSNPLTTFLGILAFILYVAVYTPLKRRSMTALFVGAIPGALPPMMGWTAMSGRIDLGAWLLFGMLFFWQLPHFIAISLYRLEEYRSAGLQTLPGTLGIKSAQGQMMIYAASLILVTFIPCFVGLAGYYYLSVSILLGLAFVSLCFASVVLHRDIQWNRVVFIGSLAYLPVVLGMWVFDRFLVGA